MEDIAGCSTATGTATTTTELSLCGSEASGLLVCTLVHQDHYLHLVTQSTTTRQIEPGDVILKVNGNDVNRLSTKEVIKCMKSSELVTIKIKKDPQIKLHLKHLLSGTSNSHNDSNFNEVLSNSENSLNKLYHSIDQQSSHSIRNAKTNHYSSSSPSPEQNSVNSSSTSTPSSGDKLPQSPHLKHNSSSSPKSNGYSDHSEKSSNGYSEKSHNSNGWIGARENKPTRESLSESAAYNPPNKNKFEAYMMTGELMLKLSRNERSSEDILGAGGWNSNRTVIGPPPHPHRHHHAPRHRNCDYDMTYNSTPVSPIDTRTNSAIPHAQRFNSITASNSLSRQQNRCSEPTMPESSYTFNSTPTSPSDIRCGRQLSPSEGAMSDQVSPSPNPHPLGCVRTSRSEDHLQKESSMSAVAIDIDDDDVTSSLNTLLDTRPDSRGNSSGRHPTDRIVWTYNAPVSSSSEKNTSHYNGSSSTTVTSNSTSVSEGISPQRSLSPASPTSVSSSVMSSNSVSSRTPPSAGAGHLGEYSSKMMQHMQHSTSEAVSNISSPDYQEQGGDMFNGRDCMEVSDPSDSDSTILVSEPCNKRIKCGQGSNPPYMTSPNPSDTTLRQSDSFDNHDHKIVIQVKGPMLLSNGDHANNLDSKNNKGDSGPHTPESQGYQELKDDEACANSACSSPEDSSEADADSLHSFHYSPKAVDIPSAIRLAKRLYLLDGFKKSDVSRHLSKNNDFSRAVAEEYLRYFSFDKDTLDGALRKFLKQFSLTGETQERERVLVHFSRRYLDCNPGSFNSQDAVHTLTCAIMLLNTDLHGQSARRKMTCTEFIENLADLNDGANFPRDILKSLYYAIKTHPLEWALDYDAGEPVEGDASSQRNNEPHPNSKNAQSLGSNPFLDVPDKQRAVEYKKGYVMRKCCYESNGKKTPFGKRGWKMFYCTLRDLILYLHKDEHGFKKNQLSDNLHNAIRIHHALATKATDYTKKQYVFRLQTADQAEYLFQTSDSKELQSWIDTINFVCAKFSAQPLAGAVGSQKKFQRPLLPCSHTKLNIHEQLRDHEERCVSIETELTQCRSAASSHHNRERESYLHSELKRYKTYAYLLRSRISQWNPENCSSGSGGGGGEGPSAPLIGEMDESEVPSEGVSLPLVATERYPPPSNSRYSYRQAIYTTAPPDSDVP